MDTNKTNITASVLALAVFGCDGDGLEDGLPVDDEVSWRETVDNGMRINGMRINGMRINGMRINGNILYGDVVDDSVELVDVALPCPYQQKASMWVEQGNLHVRTTTGVTLTGPALANTSIKLKVTEGGVARERDVWIAGVEESVSQPGLWLYHAETWDDVLGWGPVCTDSKGFPTQAILLDDVWNPKTGDKISPRPTGAMTMACRDAALAKCVEFGYVPWKVQDGVSMADYHQACTRMIRADYCGDGNSHTVNGTRIHVLDGIGVQTPDPGANYVIEAEWGPDGAVCLNPGNTRLASQPIGCQIPVCGKSFASGGLIQSGKLVAP